MCITLEKMVYFDQNLHTYTFEHCLLTGMQNGDVAKLSISQAGDGQMLITLERHIIF